MKRILTWVLLKVLGTSKRELQKSFANSSTTKTVMASSVSTIALTKAILMFLAELGFINSNMVDETAMVISAVAIPFISRLFTIIRSKIQQWR